MSPLEASSIAFWMPDDGPETKMVDASVCCSPAIRTVVQNAQTSNAVEIFADGGDLDCLHTGCSDVIKPF